MQRERIRGIKTSRQTGIFVVLATLIVMGVGCATASSSSAPTVTNPAPAHTRAVTTTTATQAPPTAARPPNTATNVPPSVTSSATSIPNTPTAISVPGTATPTTVLPTATLVPLISLPDETVAGWNTFVSSLEADPANAQGRVNQFWDTLTESDRVPLLLNDGAVFLYKGDAQSVLWRGDFSYWQFGKGVLGQRIPQTDLWYGIADFPRDSRTDYEIVLNGGKGMLDPANPHIQGGGLGDNSILAMPDYQVTDFTKRRADVPQGTLTDWIALDSQAWGEPINYRVYTPPGYDALENLPVLYVTDGNDFSDEHIGGVQVAIDNLLADGKIKPLIAVFIDARKANNPAVNIRETQFLAHPVEFAEMITTELIPTIDENYHTNPTREGRTLLGVSFGGAFTTFAGLKYPDIFGNLTIFSPAYWVLSNPDSMGGSLATGARGMNTLVQSKLAEKGAQMGQKIFLSGGIPAWDVGDLKPWVKSFQQIKSEVQLFHSQEGHSWGAWAGLTDEMLVYFFGT